MGSCIYIMGISSIVSGRSSTSKTSDIEFQGLSTTSHDACLLELRSSSLFTKQPSQLGIGTLSNLTALAPVLDLSHLQPLWTGFFRTWAPSVRLLTPSFAKWVWSRERSLSCCHGRIRLSIPWRVLYGLVAMSLTGTCNLCTRDDHCIFSTPFLFLISRDQLLSRYHVALTFVKLESIALTHADRRHSLFFSLP